MAYYFVDSSALVKRYVVERGTTWVEDLCAESSHHALYIVRVGCVEIVAALFRRARSGSLSLADAEAAAAQFKADASCDFEIVEVTEPLVATAVRAAEKHGLRAYDAIQLAAALELRTVLATVGVDSLTWVCADAELNAAALAEGFAVQDPNDYP